MTATLEQPEVRTTDIMPTTAIESMSRAEIDVQIATAHRFPRSVSQFKAEALAMATHDEETAASCFYKLTRKEAEGGVKIIEGPSVRLAEIISSCWGNMRSGARIIAEDDQFITAQGVAHDLEKNVSTSIEVRRRITNKYGKKYSPDMIAVTANAACALAFRNANFKVIPKVFVNSIYEAAKKVAIGNATTLVERRSKAVEYFAKMNVSKERILAVIGKPGIEDIDLNDLETLIGLRTSIKDGDMSVDEAFPPVINMNETPMETAPGKQLFPKESLTTAPEKTKRGRKSKQDDAPAQQEPPAPTQETEQETETSQGTFGL